ncbi:LuxR C-terminal-related transcriptional regulator [Herbiconiux sp. P17]|uniref:helix-turn-helix transcriptional regulator n=1 Tax=Herbiconiux wuyangfengii TaxID=3342794 RepID=UPI0035B9275F
MDRTVDDASPYVGRQSESLRALTALRAGIGVVVAGNVGSGRSRFVREVMRQVDGDLRTRLWAGHDLDLLEEGSAARFAQAVRAKDIVPIAWALSRRRLPEPIDELRREGALVVVELGPLSARELLLLVEDQLGGKLAPATVPTFVPARGGEHIAALKDSLSTAQLSGALTLEGDIWSLTSPMPRSEPLRALVFTRARTDVRTEFVNAEAILDVLGLAPDLGLAAVIAVLAELGAVDDVEIDLERLEETGLITILSTPSGPKLRIRDGIDESMIVLTIGVLKRRRLAAALVDVLGALPASELAAGELIAIAQHSLDLGLPVAEEAVTRAARASLRTQDAARSLRFATAAVDAGGGFDAEMTMAAAEAQAGSSRAALARLGRIADEALDDVQRTAALQAMIRHVRESAVQTVDIIDRDSVDRLALSDARRGVLKGLMLYYLGEPAAAAELIIPALPELTGLESAEAHFHVGAVHLILGHIGRAADALDDAEAAYDSVGADASSVHMLRAHVNVLRGRIGDSLPGVRAFRDRAAAFGQPAAQAMCGWAIGNLLLASGSVNDALEEFRSTITILEEMGLSRTCALVRLDLAFARAVSGDETGALEALPWASPDDHGAGMGVSGKYLQVEGWIHASGGRREEARASFVRAADTYAAGGFLLPSLSALVDAARVGEASSLIGRIRDLAMDMDGACVAVMLRFSDALAAEDSVGPADAIDAARVAGEFDEIGAAATAIDLQFLAAEALHHAAGLHHRFGDERQASASGRLRDARIAACGLVRLPLVEEEPSMRLSERELELAGLAASGLTNREIAEQLVLSVRTVETHLQRVYRKLGVRGRAEIDEALKTS